MARLPLHSREANLVLSRKRGDKKDKEAHARQVLEGIFTALDGGGSGMVELGKAAEHAKVSRKTIQPAAAVVSCGSKPLPARGGNPAEQSPYNMAC